MSTAEIFTQHAKDYYIAPDKEHFQRIIFDTFASKCTLWGYLTRQFQCITINCKICFRTKYRHTLFDLITAHTPISTQSNNSVVCVEVLRPSQPNGVMSSAVSLPNHTFTGQA